MKNLKELFSLSFNEFLVLWFTAGISVLFLWFCVNIETVCDSLFNP